jgi:V8-like Glu-specific endopeptidase
MITEVVDTTQPPYSAIVSIRSTFSDGTVSYGTGSLVGKNDVLTATHVVYKPGVGQARTVQVYPGADFNGSTGVLEYSPFGSYFSGSIVCFPDEVYIDSNNASTSLLEVRSDVALIGLTRAVGLTTGWLGLATGHNDVEWALEIGYPGTGTGMMEGQTLARSSNGMWITGYRSDGSALLGTGSSGGPLVIQENQYQGIIGVKSSGNSSVNYWGDIDYKYTDLLAAINANDNLIGGSEFVTGSLENDVIVGSAFNDVIDGLLGMDTVTYSLSYDQVSINTTGNHETNVISSLSSARADTLTNIERLSFSDTNIALDIGPTENAGSVYMLYKAAFNRAPDADGMGYWLFQKDDGANIIGIAQGFVNAPEFTTRYGLNPSNADYVNNLYLNVLDRVGEPDGVTYWNEQLDAGNISKAELLVLFATLPEGAANVASLIANGIPYAEYLG